MALPAYQAPNALNFEPIQQGFNAISQNALARNQQAMEQQRLGMEQATNTSQLQTQGLQRQQIQQNITKQHLDLLGGVSQDIANDPDPASRARRWSTIARTFDDQDLAAFKKMGIDPSDAMNAPQQVTALVRGYQNPQDVALKKAQIAAEQAKVTQMQSQQEMIKNLLAPTSTPPPQQPQPQAMAPQQQGQAQPAPPGANVAGNAAGALPQPGDATAANGAMMPSMQTTPEYYTDEDRRNIALGLIAPRALSAIQQSPGHLIRTEQAKTVGKEMGQLEERQRAGRQILQTLGQLGATANDPNVNDAIGPYNTLPGAQMLKSLVPGNKSYDLNNRLNHDVEGLVTSFISSASRSGMTMSDKRQEAFKTTMGAMMKATSKPEFDKIMSDATNIIANTFNIPPAEAAAYIQRGASPQAAGAAPQTQTAPKYTAKNSMGHVIYSDDGKTWRETP